MAKKDFSRFPVNPSDPIRHAETITPSANSVIDPATRAIMVTQAGTAEVCFLDSNTASNTYTSVVISMANNTVYPFCLTRIYNNANTTVTGIVGLW